MRNPVTRLRLWWRNVGRLGAFAQARKKGMSVEDANDYASAFMKATPEDDQYRGEVAAREMAKKVRAGTATPEEKQCAGRLAAIKFLNGGEITNLTAKEKVEFAIVVGEAIGEDTQRNRNLLRVFEGPLDADRLSRYWQNQGRY